MNTEQQRELDVDGFVLLKGVISADQVKRLNARLEELWAAEGERAGEENYIEKNARRLANLANKGDIFRAVFNHPQVVETAQAVIGPHVRINMFNAREAPSGADARQPWHVDTDHGGKPDEKGYYVCTAVWMLDDFTPANGATHIVRGSHRTHQLPKEALNDLYASHPDEVVVEGKAGDVFVFNGHCWHAGGANTTDQPRRALLVHYIRSDQPLRLNPKEALSSDAQARMDPDEREILGLND